MRETIACSFQNAPVVSGYLHPVPVWPARNFLDLSADVQLGAEGGLLSIAFHPEFERNGFVYAAYTAIRNGGLTIVIRGTVPDRSSPRVDEDSIVPVAGIASTERACAQRRTFVCSPRMDCCIWE